MRRRFFVEQFNGNSAILEGAAAHHLARVLRAEIGQLYELSDGKALFLARVDDVGRDFVKFVVLEPLQSRTNRFSATLLLAIVKYERFEWALEKATELGVTSVVPIAAGRSEKGLIAAAPKRAARWQKILAESAQQARCVRHPELREMAKSAAAFEICDADLRILLSERSEAPPLRSVLDSVILRKDTRDSTQIAFAIGPEGGWTDEEFASAKASGFHEASLGANILRTETAVVAALGAAHLYLD
jgi:16S rRNA (uracil1498-N3)-methyltransferase